MKVIIFETRPTVSMWSSSVFSGRKEAPHPPLPCPAWQRTGALSLRPGTRCLLILAFVYLSATPGNGFLFDGDRLRNESHYLERGREHRESDKSATSVQRERHAKSAVEEQVALNTTHTSLPCRHGRYADAAQRCVCFPCWDGADCDTYVDNYAPRFLVHKATAVVPVNVTGFAYRAWASDEDLGLTCPLGPGEAARCPCASFTYQLFSPSGDHRFSLHPSTGLMVRRQDRAHNKEEGGLEEGKTYSYKLMVQSVLVPGYSQERFYDILDLEIYVGPSSLQKTPWI